MPATKSQSWQKQNPMANIGNYTDVLTGSSLTVLVPIKPGEAEVRYMSGQGSKVLARRTIIIVAKTG